MKNIAIITGGNKGIGLGLAKEYHKNGYEIISISRSKNQEHAWLEHYACDLSNTTSIEPTLLEIVSKIDKKLVNSITLINNAGTLGTINTIEKLSPNEINTPLTVNLIAPMILSSCFIRLTKEWTCKKQIFNISSGAAVFPYESWGTYCSSKAGLDMMTKVIAKEQSEISNGTSIVSIYPGVVDTNMQNQIRKTPKENFKNLSKFVDLYENEQLVSPTEVAEKMYQLDNSGKLTNGLIIDIRNL